MKKTVIFIGLVLLAVSGMFAQVGETWYYKYNYTVDSETGVRSVDSNMKDVYITFTKNSCYCSDEKGISNQLGRPLYNWASGTVHLYQGEQNNVFVYMGTVNESIYRYKGYISFSKDYKRMNYNAASNLNNGWFNTDFIGNLKIIHVYDKTDPPKKEEPKKGPEAPKQLW